MCASFPVTYRTYIAKQYNLELAKGQWGYVAGKVTAGLAESNGSYTVGFMSVQYTEWMNEWMNDVFINVW